MKKIYALLLAILCIIEYSQVSAQISGAVFKDFNANGIKDINEPFAEGVTVTAYSYLENVAATATTTSPLTGTTNYSLAVTTYPVRLEFVIPSSGSCVNKEYDLVGYNASVYGSNVRFVTATTATANFALNNPYEYVRIANPYFYTARQIYGDPLAGSGTATTGPAIEATPYLSANNAVGATTPAQRTLASSFTGTIYGLAYNKSAGKLFAGASLKRHAGFGTAQSGGIYIVDSSLSTASVNTFYNFDLNGIPTRSNAAAGAPAYGAGVSYTVSSATAITYNGATDPISGLPFGQCVIGTNAARGLTGNANTPTNDPAAFGQAAVVGLGDIEMSDDDGSLYAVNLYDRKLYRLDLNNPTNPTAVVATTGFTLPNPPLRNTLGGGYATTYAGDNANFYNGVKGRLRPYGLKFYRGKLYVGAVTTGEGTGAVTTTDNNTGNPEYTDLWAYVFEFDPETNTWANAPVFQTPLNFFRSTNGMVMTKRLNCGNMEHTPAISHGMVAYACSMRRLFFLISALTLPTRQ